MAAFAIILLADAFSPAAVAIPQTAVALHPVDVVVACRQYVVFPWAAVAVLMDAVAISPRQLMLSPRWLLLSYRLLLLSYKLI